VGGHSFFFMKLWIDTDAGVDDATAILLCLDAEGVDVVGISCVGGNTSLQNVIRNVNRTLKIYRREDIPIYAGCTRALIQPPMEIPEIHGKDGLGDIDDKAFGIDTPHRLEKEHAVEAIIKAADEIEDLCLLCLGPLTNIACAIRMSPEKMLKIKHMFIMGGAEDGNGNTSPYAEFNWRCDPEAAEIVLTTYPQPQTTIISWTLTCTHTVPPGKTDTIVGYTDTIIEKFVNHTWKTVLVYTKDHLLMADPYAAFVTCYADKGCIVESEKLKLSVVLNGEKVGMSVAESSEEGCIVVKKLNFEMFKEAMFKMMKRY
jgi:inosine-uridine nucleoside N-ribohydrolase